MLWKGHRFLSGVCVPSPLSSKTTLDAWINNSTFFNSLVNRQEICNYRFFVCLFV